MSRRKAKHRVVPPSPAPAGKTTPTSAAVPAADSGRPAGYRDSLPVRHRHAAGIDLSPKSHWVAGPPRADDTPDVQEFEPYTDSLEALADWCVARGITTVALEATGIYWEALVAILEARGLEVLLVAPKYTSGIQGRPKSDRLDCQWIQRLHAHGLLPASFRPAPAVRVLRHYLRQRTELVRAGARHIQHMQKALEQMNLKLPEVLSDLTGVTGQKIIQAILAGERDPLTLAQLRNHHCRNAQHTFARALHGAWHPEMLFALRQAYASWQHFQAQLRDLEDQIQNQLRTMKQAKVLPPLPPRPRVRGRNPNDPRFDVRTALYYVTGVDLTELEGIGELTALVVVSEVGLDMSRFPTVLKFCAWLGLAPLTKQSGKKKTGQPKVKSARTRRGRRGRAAQALCLAAGTLWANRSALGAYLRRLKGRLGPPKAVVATAHKLARLLYRALQSGTVPTAASAADYEAHQQQRARTALIKKARRLGLEVIDRPTATAAPA